MKNILEATKTKGGYGILTIIPYTHSADSRIKYVALISSSPGVITCYYNNAGTAVLYNNDRSFDLQLQSERDILIEKCKNIKLPDYWECKEILNVYVIPEEYWNNNQYQIIISFITNFEKWNICSFDINGVYLNSSNKHKDLIFL